MNYNDAIKKLETWEGEKTLPKDFSLVKKVFNSLLRHKENNYLRTLLYFMASLNKYEWITQLASKELMTQIENSENIDLCITIYSLLIFISLRENDDDETLYYAYKAIQIDDHKNSAGINIYLVVTTLLIANDLFKEALPFGEKLIIYLKNYAVQSDTRFCCLMNCLQIITNLEEKDESVWQYIVKEVNYMLENSEFKEYYQALYDLVNAELQWHLISKQENSVEKREKAKNIIEAFKAIVDFSNIAVDGIEFVLEALRFYIEIGEHEVLKTMENILLEYFQKSQNRTFIMGLYAEFYDKLNDKEKAYYYYKSYADQMIRDHEKIALDKKKKLAETIKQYYLTEEKAVLLKTIQFDFVTGCYSRNYLKSNFNDMITGTLLLIDIDNLKQLNDRYGHLFGDRCIIYFSKVIRDYAEKEMGRVFRFGGDEFVVQLPITDQRSAESFVKKLYKVFEKEILIGENEIKMNFSTGITLVENVLMSMAFNEADQAMYKMKAAKKNSYLFF